MARKAEGVFWVGGIDPHRLAVMARPRGGEWLESEVQAWREAGLCTVVSFLEPSEERDLELTSERSLCEAHGLEFVGFPIPDRGVPSSTTAVQTLARRLAGQLRNHKPVAVHCRAGIGRSGLIAACVLTELGVSFNDLFPTLSRSRGVQVPDTEKQVEWVRRYSKERGVAL